MVRFRGRIPDFELANPIYIGAAVTFYEADSDGLATTTLATLYSAAVGATTVSNPQTLDSEGKLAAPVFIDTPVIASVSGALADPHSTGVIAPRGTHKGDWVTATRLSSGDTVRDATTGSLYAASNDFTTSATLAADVTANNLEIIVDASQILTDLTSNFAKAIDLAYTFSTTTAMADPGAGVIRLNNAALASVTSIALDYTTAATGNPDVSAYLATFDDSTNATKGHLMLRRPSAPENFAIFAVTALTDNSGWVQLTATHVASAGSFSSDDTITATFHRAGDKGLAVSPGVLYDFASSTSMADPGAGNIRLNNATLSNVTAFAVNDASAAPGNSDVSGFLLTWDDSTAGNKGLITIKKIGEPENFVVFQLSGLTDNTSWIEFAVSYIDHAGSFSANDNLSVEFVPTVGATATAPVQDVAVTSSIGVIDAGKLLRATAAVTFNLEAAATLTGGWYCFVYADGGAITIDPDGSETVNGATNLVVSENNGGILFCSGSAFFFIDTVSTNLGGWQALATAATADLGSLPGYLINLTGTTGVTSFGTAPAGTFRRCRADGVFEITNNAVSLILQGGTNITTASGDVFDMLSEGSGNWRMVGYTAAQEDVKPRSGAVISSKTAEYSLWSTITATIPFDNTIPQITEGAQLLTLTMSPKSASSKFRVRGHMTGSHATAGNSLSIAIFRVGQSDAVCANVMLMTNNDFFIFQYCSDEDAPATASNVEYTLRVGPGTGSMKTNGRSAQQYLNGAMKIVLEVEELAG